MASKDLVDLSEHMKYLDQPGFLGYDWYKKWETIKGLMRDSVDCHCWMALDYTGNPLLRGPIDRPYDDITIAKKATDEGMKAIVFGCHIGPSFFRVPIIQKEADEYAAACGKRPVKVLGSITLNNFAGGLNPEVVRIMVRFGGKVIYLPTVDGWNFRHSMGIKGGIEIVKGGKVVPAMEEIVGIAAENNLILNITHADPNDRMILFDDAKKAGVKGQFVYLLSTVKSPVCWATEEQWLELAKKGMKFAPSHSMVISTSADIFKKNWELLKKIGMENIISATDLNNWGYPPSVDGLEYTIIKLLVAGMSESDAERVFKTNSAKLLGL